MKCLRFRFAQAFVVVQLHPRRVARRPFAALAAGFLLSPLLVALPAGAAATSRPLGTAANSAMLGASAAPTSSMVSVTATDAIYGPGNSAMPNGGTMPPVHVLPTGASIVTFPAVSGLWTISTGCGTGGPNGNSGCGLTSDISAYGGISGFRDATPGAAAGALVGLFLSNATPTTPPPTIDFTGQHNLPSYSPLLGQVFFVGDGTTSGGGLEQYHVPAGATRLFLGMADASSYHGMPDAYFDNSGTLSVAISATPSDPPVGLLPPEFNCPATAPMLSVPTSSATPPQLRPYVPATSAATVGGRPFGSFRTEGNQIVDQGGRTVRLKAVNWYGAESADFVPMGLDQQPVNAIAQQIAAMGFNIVRLPWSNELIECNPLVPLSLVAKNPQFKDKPAMTVFDGVVNALGEAGLMVILDNHLTDAGWCCGASDNNDLWWSGQRTRSNSDFTTGQAHWVADWAAMVQRYANQLAVIGMDLRNEPRGATYWGGTTQGQPNGAVVDSSQASPNNSPSCPVSNSVVACDWRWAAQQEGNTILAVHPGLLIFVEGTSFATDLTGAYTSPVILNDPGQLVYSPHVYPFADYCNANSQSQCPVGSTWEGGGSKGTPPPCKFGPIPFPCTPFTTFAFLANWKGLGRALDSQWGFLAESGDSTGMKTPVWIGEFGTNSWSPTGMPEHIDRQTDQNRWFLNLVHYLGQRQFSWSYWALNGTQSDSGPITVQDPPRLFGNLERYGILNRAWNAANGSLLMYLAEIR
jgi:endoglucanase